MENRVLTRVKSKQEIDSMRRAGKILAQTLQVVEVSAKPGMSTKDLAVIAQKELSKNPGAKPVFLGYEGFPDVICISINDEIIHGIPRTRTILKDGDLVSIDFGVDIDGMITDAARTFVVGNTNSANKLLINKTLEALNAGIGAVKETATIKDIAKSIENVLKSANLGIVKEFVGHGVGHQLHEEPNIPNYVQGNQDFKLLEGMTIAIEPMAVLGDPGVLIDNDGWTVRTKQGAMSAHFEDTILVTKNGFEILTRN